MARMLVIYKTPQDTAAFDKHYFEVHIPLAKQLPGFGHPALGDPLLYRTPGATAHRRGEVARGDVHRRGDVTQGQRLRIALFDDLEHLREQWFAVLTEVAHNICGKPVETLAAEGIALTKTG